MNGFHFHEFSLVFIISQFHWSSGSVQALSFLLHHTPVIMWIEANSIRMRRIGLAEKLGLYFPRVHSSLLHVAEEVRQQCQVICIFQVLQALSGGPLYAIECSVVYIKR